MSRRRSSNSISARRAITRILGSVVVIALVGLLVYTLGAFAYGMTLVLWTRDLRHAVWPSRAPRVRSALRENDVVNGALLGVSFAWFCVNAVVLFLRLGPRTRHWQLDVATIVLAFAFPPLIMHSVWGGAVQASTRSVAPAWRALLWPAYAVAALIPAFCLAVFSSSAPGGLRGFAGQLLGYSLPLLFVGTGIYSVALIGRQPAKVDVRSGQERRWLLGLFGLMVLLFVALLAVGILSGASGWPAATSLLLELEIAAKSLPLAFIFVGAYFENRFDFFDLFVKRGLGLMVSIGLTAAAFAVLLPVLRPVEVRWIAPWLYAIALVPFMAALPSIHARIGTVLDRRWLGRRFTAVEAVTRFLTRLKAATAEPQLVASAQQGLAEIFDAPCAIDLGSGTPAGATSSVMHETLVQSGDATLGRILMGPRASEAPYFREDVELLASLADVLASVLVNLRLQEKKKEQEQLAQELSLHASRSELKALRAQINPHFLFNALNAIAGLIHRNPRAADRTIEQLADVFRYALRGAESEWASLGDEVEFVGAYLDVERARFGDRLQADVSIAPEVRDARVPTMAVQTLVENAVKHGLSELRGPATVQVTARRDGGRLVVAVIDNGPGFSKAALAAKDAAPGARGGYGLSNIRQRLDGYFGSDAALTIDRDRTRDLTVVSMSLPLIVDPAAIGAAAAPSARTEEDRAGRETPR